MKKAKIALTAIAIFAVVGGALAFKAKRGAVVFYRTTTTTTAPCNYTLPNYTLDQVPGAATRTGFYTAEEGGLCTVATIYSRI